MRQGGSGRLDLHELTHVTVLPRTRTFDGYLFYRLYRGVDPRDVAQAHALALSSNLQGFQIFNVSAASPFQPEDTPELLSNAADVILKYYPWAEKEFARRGWRLPASIDRVYVIGKAQKMLGYRPEYNFASLFVV